MKTAARPETQALREGVRDLRYRLAAAMAERDYALEQRDAARSLLAYVEEHGKRPPRKVRWKRPPQEQGGDATDNTNPEQESANDD